jgi:hypothetical protein
MVAFAIDLAVFTIIRNLLVLIVAGFALSVAILTIDTLFVVYRIVGGASGGKASLGKRLRGLGVRNYATFSRPTLAESVRRESPLAALLPAGYYLVLSGYYTGVGSVVIAACGLAWIVFWSVAELATMLSGTGARSLRDRLSRTEVFRIGDLSGSAAP